MSLSTSVPLNTRIITDPNYIVSALFPTATQPALGTASISTSGSTSALDFVQKTPYPTIAQIILQVDTSTLIGTSGSFVSRFFIQHSDDNVSFVKIPQLASNDIFDSAGTSSASSTQYLLPPNVKRYVRLQASSSAGGSVVGGITGSYTASVLF